MVNINCIIAYVSVKCQVQVQVQVISDSIASATALSEIKEKNRYSFSDHLPKDVRDFAAEGGHSLLWPEATTFLSPRRAHLRTQAAIVACGRRPQGFMSQKSRLNPGHLVTLDILVRERSNIISLTHVGGGLALRVIIE